jgi:hypothetical protein
MYQHDSPFKLQQGYNHKLASEEVLTAVKTLMAVFWDVTL